MRWLGTRTAAVWHKEETSGTSMTSACQVAQTVALATVARETTWNGVSLDPGWHRAQEHAQSSYTANIAATSAQYTHT